MKDFASLHTHSSYSQLDGASKIPELVSRAKSLGMSSLGISDHGHLNGLIEFYRECRKQEVKPVLGQEFYFTDDRLLKEMVKQQGKNGDIDGSDKRYYHLSVYAQNNDGYKSLLKLSSDAFINGFHHKPRSDYAALEKHSKGLIVGSGCLGGPVLQPLLHGNVEAAERAAQRLQDIVGEDNFYIELMRHGLPEQARTNPQLIDIAKRIGAPIYATQDTHYTHAEDHTSHDSLLCQPPGTIVNIVEKGSSKGLPKGEWKPREVTQKRIENIVVGDRVVSWRSIERRGKLLLDGNIVTKVGSREYNDELIIIKTPSGASSSYTKDHICIARTDQDLTKGNFVVYLMRKGNSYRIGMTQYRKTYSNNTIGPVVRVKENNAEDVWILDIFQTRHAAAEAEQYLSWLYGIPTWSFPNQRKKEHEPRTPYYTSLWSRVGDLTAQAKKCLEAHGKMIEYPFFSQLETRFNQRRPMTVRACNLEEGMYVCEPAQMNHGRVDTYDGSNAWQPISITRKHYFGPVYSMDVDENHTYIADGIVTHNCCQTGSKLADENRFRFHGHEYYLKSPDQMYDLFSDLPEACDNTLAIAEKCNVEIDFSTLHLPKFPIPDGFIDDVDYLAELTLEGIQKRYPNAIEEVWDRVGYELSVIQSMGLASYFLICWDIIRFAKSQGILTGPGRGSSAGSIVCYALGVTKVDPLKHDLIFERFINPERIALADVDMDIASWGRDTLINYTKETYGEDFVAQIVTFTKIKARTAVRDAARVLDLPPSLGDKVAKAMPPLIMGVDTPLAACFTYDPKFDAGYKNAQGLRDMYNKDPDVKRIVDIGLGLEGLVRGDGIHAAAVVIGDRPLDELVPLQRRPEKGGGVGPIVTQYEKNTIEDLGLLKMDYLGLSNLDVITDCLKLMGQSLDFLDDIPMEDLAVFETLRRGEGIGLFQIESLQMRQLLLKLGPRNMDDISAVLALYRPGPMAANMHNDYADRRNDRQRVTYFHKDAEPILEKTQGLMFYQEGVMEIAKKFAGYTMPEADNLRKIMGKKLPDKMALEKSKFIQGCVDSGYPELGEKLFDLIEGFASYGFCAGHSYAYSYITYWTAYLKTYYPREYMAALCTGVMDDLDKTAVYLNEVRRMGLKVYPPDINLSRTEYTVEEDGIRIGLHTLKNVGEAVTIKTIKEREEKQFSSLYDFAVRVNPNSQAFKSFAYSGALDNYGSRQGIGSVIDEILKSARKEAKKIDQESLFAADTVVDFKIPDTEFPWHLLLNKEKETLGLYVSGHPLADYSESKTKITIDDIKNIDDDKSHKVLVIINTIELKYTKKQETMAIVNVEDQTGTVDVVIFPSQYEKVRDYLKQGAVAHAWIRPGTDFRDQRNYIIGNIEPVQSKVTEADDKKFGIFLPKGFNLDPAKMARLKGIFLEHYGSTPVDIYISRSTVIKLDNQYLVDVTSDLKNSIKDLFKQKD